MGSPPAAPATTNNDPLAEIENTLKREVKIDYLQDFKANRDAQRLRAQQIQAQAQMVPPGYVPAPGYMPMMAGAPGAVPYGMPAAPQPAAPAPAPQVPVPMVTPVDKDGKPDTNAIALMGALSQPNNPLAYLLMLPQLLSGLGGARGDSGEALKGLVEAMTALKAIQATNQAPQAESGTDTFLKAVTAVKTLTTPPAPAEPAISEIDKLNAQLAFFKGLLEMNMANKAPAPAGDQGAQMITALATFMSQQAAQTQQQNAAMMQQQMNIMNQQIEWYKAQASAPPPNPLDQLQMIQGYAETLNKLGALHGPQAQDPKFLLELEKLKLDQAKQAHQESLDSRKSEGWMNIIGNGMKNLTEAFSGKLGETVGEGLKDSLKMAAQAQIDGRGSALPGPIVQVSPPQFAPQPASPMAAAPMFMTQPTYAPTPMMPQSMPQPIPQMPLPPQMAGGPNPAPQAQPTAEMMDRMQDRLKALNNIKMSPSGNYPSLGGGVNPNARRLPEYGREQA